MKTCCPGCSTRFDVTSAQLNARQGKVRCGVCGSVFNAFDHAQDAEEDLPVLQSAPAQTDSGGHRPEPDVVYHEPVVRDHATIRDRERHVSESDVLREPALGRYREPAVGRPSSGSEREASERFIVDAPSLSGSGAYYQDHRLDGSQMPVQGQYRRRVQRDTEYDDPEHSNGSGLIWFLAVLFALIVLFAQGAVVFRNQIANVAPTLRPQLVQLCSFVGCQVGYTRSVRNLAIVKPALREVANPAAAAETRGFTLHAVIKNNDTIAQPWPSLVLSLKNASESVSARRIIKPEEYLLPDALKRTFEPKDEVAIDLPVTVSRTDVSGFELSLFYP